MHEHRPAAPPWSNLFLASASTRPIIGSKPSSLSSLGMWCEGSITMRRSSCIIMLVVMGLTALRMALASSLILLLPVSHLSNDRRNWLIGVWVVSLFGYDISSYHVSTSAESQHSNGVILIEKLIHSRVDVRRLK